jgi:hypothetical protein
MGNYVDRNHHRWRVGDDFHFRHEPEAGLVCVHSKNKVGMNGGRFLFLHGQPLSYLC